MIMLEIDPKLVDVNVHPAKLHVKFAHSKEVYEAVFAGISEALGGNKISNYQGEHHTGTAFSAPASPTQGTVRKTEEFLQGTSGISTPQVQSIF
jgi:DNA mismatch repair ATPase MutL